MNKIDKEIIEKLAVRVAELGGRAYLVGGAVRDEVMRRPIKDVDVEVHGIYETVLEEVLKELGKPLRFGSAFGVYSLAGHQIDVALPRSERKSGAGHRDFEIEINPFIGIKEAARRRDFTMNALLKDILSGEITDPYGGVEDIRNRIIRHIDDKTFGEDPLRALRAAQFRSRFGFQIAPSTISICRALDLRELSAERVEMEMKKALLESHRPSEFFECLREMGQLRYWFQELEQLIGLEQNPKFHPEGDVWTHSMMVLDRAAHFRSCVSDPYAFMLLALTHDFGKITTTEFVNGAIHAYGHEIQGAEIAERFLDRISHDSYMKRYIRNMIPNHMRPNIVAEARSSIKKTNHMFDDVLAPVDLIYFAICDKPKLLYNMTLDETDKELSESYKEMEKEKEQKRVNFLFDRLQVYKETMSKPYVTGKDLIDNGIEPGENFKEILDYAHKLRLAGIPKDSALKQTLSYARKLSVKNINKAL
ncbi:HD domain-containing protein [Mogibacterium neglectum]|uniref:CCA tRNA nucleotidyltransferase n=1 Tax=Mogibacterium neglectum TaxID=114528 RepID=UPI00272DB26A|nr:HD domain-containing protein [Mogibacterium neglectum]WLD75870.1 HD domain-containing protein [Mogibacterium neglectum]